MDSPYSNQDDLEERSPQVLRKTSIYRTAFQAVAWIDPVGNFLLPTVALSFLLPNSLPFHLAIFTSRIATRVLF